MKIQKVFLILVVLFASLQICFGQEKPKAELMDEFGTFNCEMISSSTVNYFRILEDNPTSTGYIVIYGNKDKSLEKYRLENALKSTVITLKLDANRLVFIRGKDGDSTKGEFWLVPAGADKPAFNEENWNYELRDIVKAVKFHERVWELLDDICLTTRQYSEESFSNILIGNPDFRGNIVISGDSSEDFQKIKKGLVKELVNKYKIPINRLRFFSDKNGYPDNVEYWIVPPKSK